MRPTLRLVGGLPSLDAQAERLLSHLNAVGVPVDPVGWELACSTLSRAGGSAQDRLEIDQRRGLPLAINGSGRLPVRWGLDGLLPVALLPDLGRLPKGLREVLGDGQRLVCRLSDDLARYRILATLSGDVALSTDIEGLSPVFEALRPALDRWAGGRAADEPALAQALAVGGRYSALGEWADLTPRRDAELRRAEQETLLGLAIGALDVAAEHELIAVSGSALYLLTSKPAELIAIVRHVAPTASLLWGWSMGTARHPAPPDEPPDLPQIMTRSAWAERGLAIARAGAIGEDGAAFAVGIASLDCAAQLRVALAECPKGKAQQVRDWSKSARDLRAAALSPTSSDLPRLTRGSQAEIAGALHAQIVADGQRIHFDGLEWRTSSGAAWSRLDPAALSLMLQRWDGAPIGDQSQLALNVNAGLIAGVQKLLSDRVRVDVEHFDTPTRGVVLRDRLLLSDGAHRPITAEDRIRAEHALDVTIDDPTDAPVWLAFLASVFQGDDDAAQKIAFIQEWLGAALWGEAVEHRGSPVLLGEGQNGKSIFCTVVTGLFAPDARCVVDLANLGGNHAEYYAIRLKGKALNCVFDAEATALQTTGAFKASVLGEEISGREPGGKVVDFTSRAAWLIAMNRLPKVNDSSDGFYSRLSPMRFNHTFTPAEPPFRPKEELLSDLRRERLGIILWALEGLTRLRAQRTYTVPPSTARLRKSWQSLGEPVIAWLLEVADPNGVPEPHVAGALFEDFCAWCKSARIQPIPDRRLWSQALAGQGYKTVPSGGTRRIRMCYNRSREDEW